MNKELVLTIYGGLELRNAGTSEVLWSSDDDPDFKDEFDQEFFQESDIPDVMDFLIDTDEISEEEREHVEVIEESQTDNDEEDDEDVYADDDDEYEEDDDDDS